MKEFLLVFGVAGAAATATTVAKMQKNPAFKDEVEGLINEVLGRSKGQNS